MKPVNKLWYTACLFLWAGLLAAQSQTGKHIVGARVLFQEYGIPNSVDSLDLTNGAEILYRYRFNERLSIGFPVRISQINVVEDINKRSIFAVDGTLQYHLTKNTQRFSPYLSAGVGYVSENGLEEDYTQIPLGAGFNIQVGSNSYINLQGEYRISSFDNRSALQAGLGFLYRLGGKGNKDTDGDGVKDLDDECPNEPGSESTAGCPDTDGDGLSDKVDACPDMAGLAGNMGCPDTDEDGFIDKEDECPEEPGTLYGCPDSDDDGVADKDDECPDEAGLVMGCPDRDGDGIKDSNDQCPDEAAETETGCPMVEEPLELQAPVDSDGDGFPDAEDRCPEVPGTYRGCPDTDGDGLPDPDDACPEEAGAVGNRGCPELTVEEKEVLTYAMRSVQFRTGSAKLLEESYESLDQLAAIMEKKPAYNLTISGHTDNTGYAENNRILSEERARACFQYLVAKGIDPTRITYRGYGEDRPIASNESSSGRALNRRVEFELTVRE